MKPRDDNEDETMFKPNGDLRTVEDQQREFDEIMDEMEALVEEEGKREKGESGSTGSTGDGVL